MVKIGDVVLIKNGNNLCRCSLPKRRLKVRVTRLVGNNFIGTPVNKKYSHFKGMIYDFEEIVHSWGRVCTNIGCG